MANKKQLVSNFQDKKNYPICNLNNIDNFKDDVMCIKQDCVVWFDREKLCLHYLEFSNPENVRDFHVGSEDVVKIEIIDNLIVCVKEDCIVILFSKVEKHKKWHVRLVNEPEHENGELFIRNSCLIDNLFTLSFFELIQQEGEDNGENPEFQADFKIVVWDLNYLINALEDKDLDEESLYDIVIDHVLIPINFESILVHNCVSMKLNKQTGVLEKNYYILGSTADDGIITVFIFDEFLKLKEIRNFECDVEDKLLLWASIHADGTILAIGKKEIVMFSVEDTKMENVKKIPVDVLEDYNPYDVILTPELLYIMFYTQRQVNDDEIENEVKLAIIDISDDNKSVEPKKEADAEEKSEEKSEEKEKENADSNTKTSILCSKWSDSLVNYNMFVDTGVVHYNPETKQVLFTPFSKSFCKD